VVVVVCGFVTGEVMAVGGKEEEEFMGEESALPQPESKDITLAGLIKEGYFRYDFFLSCLVMLVNEVGGRRRGGRQQGYQEGRRAGPLRSQGASI